MCEQPETDMVSGFFHGSAASGRVQAAFHFVAVPFVGRLKTKFAYKKAACTMLFKVQATFGD